MGKKRELLISEIAKRIIDTNEKTRAFSFEHVFKIVEDRIKKNQRISKQDIIHDLTGE
jgi:hypothetical protein